MRKQGNDVYNSLSFQGNVFDLEEDDRAFFFDLVDRVASYIESGV